MSIAYLNNEFLPLEDARISPMDRGFLFADGVYEVVPFFHGHGFTLEGHIQRLQRSLKEIHLEVDWKVEDWQKMIEELAHRNGGGNQSIYLQVTRGIAMARSHNFPDSVTPTIFAMSTPVDSPLAEDVTQAKGIKAVTLPDIRWKRCDIKSISLLPNILMKQQAKELGAKEAILIRDGQITECAAANVFIVKDGVIKTPGKSEHILGGITRDLVIHLANSNALNCQECALALDDLLGADEIWVCSATQEVVPVITLDGKAVGDGQVGPYWKQMAQLYQQYKQRTYGHFDE